MRPLGFCSRTKDSEVSSIGFCCVSKSDRVKKLRQRDRGFELCERAERRGFGPDEEREGERNVQEDDEGRAR